MTLPGQVSSVVGNLDVFLGSQLSADYWSDEGIGIAAALTAAFVADDWAQLSELIRQRDQAWKSRCVESLGDEASAPAAKVLLELMKDSDRDVAIAALDSLCSLAQLGLDLTGSKEAIAEVLAQFPDHPGSAACVMGLPLANSLG